MHDINSVIGGAAGHKHWIHGDLALAGAGERGISRRAKWGRKGQKQ
jgi:hypothetical protein